MMEVNRFANRLFKPTLRSFALLTAMVATMGMLSACAPRTATFADSALWEVSTNEIVLMPIVDQRDDRLDQFDTARHVRLAAPKVLAKKGYTTLTSRHLEGGERPPYEGFGRLTASELASMGPEGGELLLFVGVRGVTQSYDMRGEEYEVRLTGVLVDAAAERVLWRDMGSGKTNYFGLLSLFSPPGNQYDAAYTALANLLSTLPKFSAGEELRAERESVRR